MVGITSTLTTSTVTTSTLTTSTITTSTITTHKAGVNKTNTRVWCGVPLRYVLLFLGFLGCAVEYVLRFSISVAIVAMVNSTSHHQQNDSSSTNVCPAAQHQTGNTTIASSGGEYNWSLKEQGIILGTFFWGYLFTKCIGGRIAELVGGRLTLGVSLGLCGVLSLLCPLAASLHPLVLAGARFLMGLLQGPSYPGLYTVIVRWARQEEMATMIQFVSAGIALGLLIALGCGEWVVASLGWRWVFYGGGLLALVWIPFWFILVRDSPDQHPFISDQEKQLLSSIKVQPRKRVPWSRMLRCPTIYILALVEFSVSWTMVFTNTYSPSFLANKIGMSTNMAGTLLLVQTGVGAVLCVVYGMLSDLFYRRNIISVVATRRTIYLVGGVAAVGGFLGLIAAGCDQGLVGVFYVFLSVAFPSQPATYQVTPMDIAPNYAGTITGIIGVGQLGGFLAPIVNSHLIGKRNGWNWLLLVCAVIYAVPGVVYVLGVTAEEQEWNQYEELEDDPGLEDDSRLENDPALKNNTGLENDPSLNENSSLEDNSSLKNNPSLGKEPSLDNNTRLTI